MGACREMRLPRSESESQSMSPFSGALDSLAADGAAPAPAAGQSSSTSTEDRCFAGFALSGVESYGASEDAILIAQGNLANTYLALGRCEEALRMRREAYAGALKIFGEEHDLTLSAVVDLSDALCATSHFAEAQTLLKKFVPLAQETLGFEHIVTFKLIHNHAHALYMHHFFGYDGYTLDYAIAVGMLEGLDKCLWAGDVACRLNTNDDDEISALRHVNTSLLDYAYRHRLE